MLGANSFCMGDFLGMGDSYGDGRSQLLSALMPQEGPSVLSLQLLEDKQHLGGEDCNVPKISMKLIGTLILLISSRR